MPQKCVVINCKEYSCDRKKSGVSFYRFPKVSNQQFYTQTNELKKLRLKEWLKVINRTDLSNDLNVIQNRRVCSKHFILGAPASLYDKLHPDWIPSINLNGPTRKVIVDLLREETLKLNPNLYVNSSYDFLEYNKTKLQNKSGSEVDCKIVENNKKKIKLSCLSNNSDAIQVIEEDPLANVDRKHDILKNEFTSEIEETCRTCTKLNRNADIMKRIFNYSYDSSPVNLVGYQILNTFNICEDDELPQQICNECYNNLKRHNEFWNKCKLSQTILKNKFSTNSTNSNLIRKSKPTLIVEPKLVNLATSEILTISNNNKNNDKNNNSLSKDVTLKNNDDIFNDNHDDDVDDDEDINYDYFGDFDVNFNTKKCNDIEHNKSVKNDTSIQFQTINIDTTTNNYNDIVATNKSNIDYSDDDKNVNDIKTLSFQCKACKQYFKTEILLVQHILIVHKIDDGVEYNKFGKEIIKPIKTTTTTSTSISLPLPPLPQPKRYRCDLCDMICKTLEDVRHHKRIHYGGKYKCDKCGKFFATNSYLNKHIKNMHKVDQIVCFLCGLVFTSNSKYEYHMNTHDETKQKKCQYCDRVFICTAKRKIHERIHTGERPYLCTFCGQGYRTTGLLRSHIRTHTNKYPNTCEVCNRHFCSKPLLRKHLELHDSKITEYICEFCKEIYFNKYDLEQHHINIHMIPEPKLSVPEKLFQPSAAQPNIRILKKIPEHKCSLCGFEFLRKEKLVAHMDTVHLGTKPFACTECAKQFRHASSLEEHKRFHTGETPFKCKKCDKSFMSYKHLASHMLVHNGRDNLFQCQYCNKTYLLEHNLKVHLLKHTGGQNEQTGNDVDYDIVETEIATSILDNESFES